MSERADKKEFLNLEEDIFAFTILCLFKANRRKLYLSGDKQAQLINTCILVMVLQLGLVICVFFYISPSNTSVAYDLFN